MLPYDRHLKHPARALRNNMTDSEKRLWSRLRGKQILGVQFYRQKPIGKYVVDFFAPSAGLVVEVDGSQHQEPLHHSTDQHRDEYLESLGLRVLRFDSRQVMVDIDVVGEVIYRVIEKRQRGEMHKSPLAPL